MTVLDLPHTLPRQRGTAERTATPESCDLLKLQEMLDDPTLVGWREQIRAAIVDLTATSALAA